MGTALMISTVTDVLSSFGLLAEGETTRVHVGLTRGDTLWIDVFRKGGSFIHAKVAEYITLREEVRAHGDAFDKFGTFVPRPLRYVVQDGLEIFATEGVEHGPLWPNPLGDSWRANSLAREFLRFFEASGRVAKTSDPRHVHAALLGKIRTTLAGTGALSVAERWNTEEGLSELESLGAVPQHGDFVVNNVGTKGSRLIVFDWEDFGKVSLPGFDLCTLAMSLADAEVPGITFERYGRGSDRLLSFLKPACGAIGLDIDQFWRLVPLYLLTFLYLKQGYAAGIRTRIALLLRQIVDGAMSDASTT